MNIEHLVTMANQIASFFEAEAGPQGAPEQIASHIQRFWDPRMREQIIAHLKAGGEGMREATRSAVAVLPPVQPRST